MPTPFEELSALDKLIHEPSRLAILTALIAVPRSDFMYLQRITGLNKGNLSLHLAKLAAAGLVEITKDFVDRKPRTEIRLTEQGSAKHTRYWERVDRLRQDARAWQPAPEDQDSISSSSAEAQPQA